MELEHRLSCTKDTVPRFQGNQIVYTKFTATLPSIQITRERAHTISSILPPTSDASRCHVSTSLDCHLRHLRTRLRGVG